MTTFTSSPAAERYKRIAPAITAVVCLAVFLGIDALGRTVGLGFIPCDAIGSTLSDALASMIDGIGSLFAAAPVEPVSTGELIEVAN